MVKMGTPLEKGMIAAEAKEYRREVHVATCSMYMHMHVAIFIKN